MNEKLENQKLTKPLYVDSDKLIIGTFQEDYPLTEVELIKIIDGRPKLIDLMIAVIGALVAYVIPLISKAQDFGIEIISAGEVKIVLALCGIVFFLWIVSCFLPNEKSKAVKKIKAHFHDTEKTRHILNRPERHE